ncbi:unnamed protein product [Paramecium octaurelia]|uniref:Uncharacterized protein n=1 Tax=Paramecium octaurelia TaxID=43137 RepID=A0A8S1XQN2_PAROT|nr:unnamed protein product [Paramecium octaurelia]
MQYNEVKNLIGKNHKKNTKFHQNYFVKIYQIQQQNIQDFDLME